jgi:hypothetical protein
VDAVQPDAASTLASAPLPAGSVSSAPTEIVSRPEPHTLARGLWEAPPWAFYASMAVVLLAAILYVIDRAGLLRRRPSSR